MSARHTSVRNDRLCTTYAVAKALREQSEVLLSQPNRLISPIDARAVRPDVLVVPVVPMPEAVRQAAAPHVLRRIAREVEMPWTPRPPVADRTPAQIAADVVARCSGLDLDEIIEARLA